MVSSLTCKAWLPTCRYHLFQEIVLSPPKVLSFLRYIDSSSSDVASYISHLIVQRLSNNRILGTHNPSMTNYLAIHLEGLRSLTLSELQYTAVASEVRQLLAGLVNLSCLILHGVNFETMQQTIEFICSFPPLEILKLEGWSLHVPDRQMHEFLPTAQKLPQKTPLCVQIDHLNLDQPRSVVLFIEYIMQQTPSPVVQLDTLRLGPLHDQQFLKMPCIRNLMRLSGPCLNQLQIRAPEISFETAQTHGT